MLNKESESILQLVLSSEMWPRPKSRDYAELSDPVLFAEVLEISRLEHTVSLNKLVSDTEGLRKRLRRLWVVDRPTKTTIKGLLSAMKYFGWLEENGQGLYSLTSEGIEMYEASKNEKLFRRKLAGKMHNRYIIPGWFVYRLMVLNPMGQGEIVLPSPPKDWQTKPKQLDSTEWSKDLSRLVIDSANKVRNIFPGCFPIDNREWAEMVESNWKKLVHRKKYINTSGKREEQVSKLPLKRFTPRARLAQAMRDAAINRLFSSYIPVSSYIPRIEVADFDSHKHPIPPRSFRQWCPRLDALELIFYSDFHPFVSGRLIFPCAAFRDQAPPNTFEPVEGIKDTKGRTLYLYQPQWQEIQDKFISVLLDTYRRISRNVGALYVSLLDVRDEVCRQIRLSSIMFDSFLETAYRESIESKTSPKNIAISLESDVRAEQRSGYGLSRRPVYVNKVPHSLIAISYKRRG